MTADTHRLILASASPTRLSLLQRAGVSVVCDPASIDEARVKNACRVDAVSIERTAEALAELKARQVGRRYPGDLVLGADQMLECDGIWFDKPVDRMDALAQLRALRGRTHRLVSAVVMVQGDRRVWHHVEDAHLTMRSFSDGFLERYIDEGGKDLLGTVGTYRLEEQGAQLFERVNGDFFTILGLPLLAVLDALRERGIVAV